MNFSRSIKPRRPKGFGAPPPNQYPLVKALENRIRSGQLVTGQSSAWDWLNTLTESDFRRLDKLQSGEKGIAEIILLTIALLEMETGKQNLALDEEVLIQKTHTLIVMSSFKELLNAGLIEVEDMPQRLSDDDRAFGVRMVQEEGDEQIS